jgi:hypothetical protein
VYPRGNDVYCLRVLVAAAEDNHHRCPIATEVHRIVGCEIDLQRTDVTADGSSDSEVSQPEVNESRLDSRSSPYVAKRCKRLPKRTFSVRILAEETRLLDRINYARN